MTEPTTLNPATANDSATQAMVSTALRDMGLVLGLVTAILGFASNHNLAGAINYLKSEQALPALGVVLSVGIAAWRQWHARRAVRVLTAAVTNPGSVELSSQKGPAV